LSMHQSDGRQVRRSVLENIKSLFVGWTDRINIVHVNAHAERELICARNCAYVQST